MNDSIDRYIDWKDWQKSSFAEFDALLANYFAAETEITATPGTRVLEIGFGNGPFVGWCRSIGVEIVGVELNPELVDRFRALPGGGSAFVDLNDPGLTDMAGSFTHIVAFDVIEHIDQAELPRFFARLKLLLAADGRIIVRFPNGDSPFGRIYQHGDPTHVTTIGRLKLYYLAHQAALTVKDIRAPRLPLRGVRLRKMIRRYMVAVGRYWVERIAGSLYFGGQRIPLHPNYTAVLVPSARSLDGSPASNLIA